MSDPPAPDSALRSDPGRVRTNNEDAVGGFEPADRALRAERGCLYVVADGMGGHAAGEVASNYAVASILRDYFTLPWQGPEPTLCTAIAAANAAIHAEGSTPGEHQGMGSTVVAAALLPGRAIVANVGDSRAYLLHDGQLRQVSMDHSWIAERVAVGLLTPEEAAAHPGRNVLTRNLGFTPQTEPSVAEVPLQAGDRLLLCSDGLSGPVAEEQMAGLLGAGSAEQAAIALVAAANEAGGPDNIGLIVVAPSAKRVRPPAGTLAALHPPSWEPEPAAVQAVPRPLAAGSRRRWPQLVLGAVAAVVAVAVLTAGAVAVAGRGSSSRKTAAVLATARGAASPPPATAAPASPTPASTSSPAATSAPTPAPTAAPLLAVAAQTVSPAPSATAPPAAGPASPGDAPLPAAPSRSPTPASVAVAGNAGGRGSPVAAPALRPAAPSGGGASSGATGGGLSGGRAGAGTAGGVPSAMPPVVFQIRTGDTLDGLWQSCYTHEISSFDTFTTIVAALNPPGFDPLNPRGFDPLNPKAGDLLRLPGGWDGADCPLGAGRPF
ncbi:MAG TPA: protein phosphatase 2C domain-containing protein [Dehalococcoidia bacterium]|nr:protein phosphatase 2C domain-containing protein [Dehalococcoidia bacterium]